MMKDIILLENKLDEFLKKHFQEKQNFSIGYEEFTQLIFEMFANQHPEILELLVDIRELYSDNTYFQNYFKSIYYDYTAESIIKSISFRQNSKNMLELSQKAIHKSCNIKLPEDIINKINVIDKYFQRKFIYRYLCEIKPDFSDCYVNGYLTIMSEVKGMKITKQQQEYKFEFTILYECLNRKIMDNKYKIADDVIFQNNRINSLTDIQYIEFSSDSLNNEIEGIPSDIFIGDEVLLLEKLINKTDNIKVYIYNESEEKHSEPHFHVYIIEYSASFSIKNQELLAGYIPKQFEKIIKKWADKNKKKLMERWKDLQAGKDVTKINTRI